MNKLIFLIIVILLAECVFAEEIIGILGSRTCNTQTLKGWAEIKHYDYKGRKMRNGKYKKGKLTIYYLNTGNPELCRAEAETYSSPLVFDTMGKVLVIIIEDGLIMDYQAVNMTIDEFIPENTCGEVQYIDRTILSLFDVENGK